MEADLHGVVSIHIALVYDLSKGGSAAGAVEGRIGQIVVGVEVNEPYLLEAVT